MNKKEIVLISRLLKLASEEFSNHGCNDVDEALFKDWTIEEKQQLAKEIEEWNGTPEAYMEDHIYFMDWTLMRFLADKIIK